MPLPLTASLKKFVAIACSMVIFGAALVVAPSSAEAAGYQLPCNPYTLSGYDFGSWSSSMRGYHAGQDVACASGTPVYAVSDGQVVYSARTPDSYRWGNLIMIQHFNPDGTQITSLYGHLSNDRRVANGQMVTKGQLIGFIGPGWTLENGNWGDHLHFAMRHGPYKSAIGSYDATIHGYEPANMLATYAHPSNYINGRLVTYDYQIESIPGQGVHGKNEEYYIDFNLRNTGTATWKMNGPDAMRLGTLAPMDHVCGFSVDMIGHGWAAGHRIALMADTQPGAVGTFRARFSNKTVPPGRYIERFAPVIDGKMWLPNKNINVTNDVLPPQIRAEFYSQALYPTLNSTNLAGYTNGNYLVPGQRMNMKFFLKNSGDTPWQVGGNNPVNLGTGNPYDRPSAFATGGDFTIPTSENWPRYNRPSTIDGRLDTSNNTVVPAGVINPGDIAVFSFTMTAPRTPGYYQEYFQPVMEGVTWMNNLGMWFPMRVLPVGYHYEYAGQENPAPIPLGGGGSAASVSLRNSGQSPWPVNGNVRLGTDRLRDRASDFKGNDWLSANRTSAIDANVSVPGKSTIAPGEVAKFTFTVNDPTRVDGAYPEYFRPLVEGVAWMPEDYGIYVPVTVQSPPLQYEYVAQSFDRPLNNLRYGDTLNATLSVRNTGSQTWAANQVNLGTSRPQDRISGFAVLSGPDAWPLANRPSYIDGKATGSNVLSATATGDVAQGQIAVFRIPMKVPAGLTPGTYNEYFNLVKEGVSWLPDRNIFFPLTVLGQ